MKMSRLRRMNRRPRTLKSRRANNNLQTNHKDLRRRAEDILREKPASSGVMSKEEVLGLVHELQVHQIELEMQNDELRRTQAELEGARELYFDLFNQAPVGYLILSDKGGILAANLAAASLLGVERKLLEKTPFTRFIFREDQDIFYLGSRKALQEHSSQEFELRLVRIDGSQIDVQMACNNVDQKSLPTSQLRVMFRDITERKQNEWTLKAHAHKLEVLNQDLESFASIASHDLQEPLRKIVGFGLILEKEYSSQLGEKGRDSIERMKNAASRMESLIQDLLALSRLSTQVPKFQQVDLNRIAQEVLGDLESRIEQTGGQVEIGELPNLTAEPTEMQQLFLNLIGNALKFHKPGIPPRVRVYAVQNAARCVEIRVADNGIGFNEQAAEKIFKPFVRLHGKSEYEGTGIGLAICQRIVDNHAGKITAVSTPGQGATFIVQLPIQQSTDSVF